jgi:competence protein ComEC
MLRYIRKNWRDLMLTAAFGGALLFGVPYLERMTSRAPVPPKANEMALYVFDVGQGDSILAEEGDKQILIDGGPDATILSKLGEVMPAGDNTIDLIVLTHPHSDHVTGLDAVLKKYSVGRILKTDASTGSAVDRDFDATIKKKNIPTDNPAAISDEQVGDMSYKVLHYENQAEVDKKHKGSDDGFNDSSIVGMVSFKNKKFLLMGDATTSVEDELLAAGADLKADFLKIGHHGSAYSTGEEFLAAVSPADAIISCGIKNTYGFPAWRVLELLKKDGVKYFRTDLDGDITAMTNGDTLQVTAEKVR